MYYTGPQLMAHLTANGAALRTGDLFASGTVSGPAPDQAGSLLELSADGTRPIALDGRLDADVPAGRRHRHHRGRPPLDRRRAG